MATAVIRTGGRQYLVSEGETLRVEKLAGEPGKKIEFAEVLAIGGDSPKVGKPLVSGAKVQAEIVAQDRGDKIVIFKFRRRKKYRRKNGHRQAFTAVRITSIDVGAGVGAPATR